MLVRTLVVVVGLLLESRQVMRMPVLGTLHSGARVSPTELMAPPRHVLHPEGMLWSLLVSPHPAALLGPLSSCLCFARWQVVPEAGRWALELVSFICLSSMREGLRDDVWNQVQCHTFASLWKWHWTCFGGPAVWLGSQASAPPRDTFLLSDSLEDTVNGLFQLMGFL